MGGESQASYKDVITTIKDTEANSAGVDTATSYAERRTTYISRFLTALWSLALLFAYLLRRGCNIVVGALTKSSGDMVNIARIAMAKLFAIFSFIMMSLLVVQTASAQQREIVNPSFELVNPGGTQVFSGQQPLPATQFTIASDDFFPGWLSTNGQIEIWNEGFQNRTAEEGDYLAELNPSEPVGLFQEVCLVNGEALNWEFYHAARTTGSAPDDQTVAYEVVDSSGALIQFLDTNTVTAMGANNNQSQNDWDVVSGTAVYTGPTGIQRLQFRSTNGVASGNFLDNINVTLIPIVTFENLNTSALETATTGLPQFAISGQVPTGFSIGFTITGGTATLGADYTVTSNSISIPAGNYDGVSPGSIFPVPINILTDAITEGDETIEITYQNVTPSSAAVLSGPSCTPAETNAVHTILDVPPSLEIEKTLSGNIDEDGSGSVSIGDTLTYTVTATNTGSAAQTNFVVTDNLITPNSNTCATVAIGATCTLTGTYVVTAADAGGDIVNTASVVSDQVAVPLDDTVTTPVSYTHLTLPTKA